MLPIHSLWNDILPGGIAAGLLAAAASVFLPAVPLLIPLTAFLAAATVYAADHHLAPDRPPPLRVKVLLGLCSCVLAVVFLSSNLFHLPIAGIYLLASLGYVLIIPGTRFRLQDHPWLRPLLISLGWGFMPFLLRDVPLSPRTVYFSLGTSALFFSTVFWSDLKDLDEDRSRCRMTPAQILNRPQTNRCIAAGYLVSIAGYAAGDVILFAVPAVVGLVFMILKTSSILIRYGDLLLLWFGVAAVANAAG